LGQAAALGQDDQAQEALELLVVAHRHAQVDVIDRCAGNEAHQTIDVTGRCVHGERRDAVAHEPSAEHAVMAPFVGGVVLHGARERELFRPLAAQRGLERLQLGIASVLVEQVDRHQRSAEASQWGSVHGVIERPEAPMSILPLPPRARPG
jgi:hypothetical protein